MLGFSTGQLLVILGACSVMMKPSDMVKIARTAGRMTGRAVGRLIVARRQLDEILGQSAATQVHKELKDAMTQLDSIRYEVQNLSRLTPGQFMMKQHNTGMAEAGKSDSSDGPTTNQEEFRQEIRSIVCDEIKNFVSTSEARKLDVAAEPTTLKSKDMKMANSGLTNLHSQAMTYARLSEAPGLKMGSCWSGDYQEQFKESNGLLNVLPISAESAGLLPSRPVIFHPVNPSPDPARCGKPTALDGPTGSDLVLEAVLEAEVAENAKLFVSQPHDQLPKE